jgi:hypothetical protein
MKLLEENIGGKLHVNNFLNVRSKAWATKAEFNGTASHIKDSAAQQRKQSTK